MPSFRRWLTGPLHHGRVCAFVILGLIGLEALLRSVTLYPFSDERRFGIPDRLHGLPPTARQLAESVDHVRSSAAPGDWVLIGDSILNGVHVKFADSPASVLRSMAAQRKSSHHIWDLTVSGADPALESAILSRLGPLPGVKLVLDAGPKVISHPRVTSPYFAQFWNDVGEWPTTEAPVRAALHELVENYFWEYERDKTHGYGENVSEARATIWLNSQLTLLSLDHWVRYHLTAYPLPKLIAQMAKGEFGLHGTKEIDEGEEDLWEFHYDHTPRSEETTTDWWGGSIDEGKPLWRAFVYLLDQLHKRGGESVLSVNTISLKQAAVFRQDLRAKLLGVYGSVKNAAVARGVRIVEPNLILDDSEYADADHLAAPGIRRWMEQIVAVQELN